MPSIITHMVKTYEGRIYARVVNDNTIELAVVNEKSGTTSIHNITYEDLLDLVSSLALDIIEILELTKREARVEIKQKLEEKAKKLEKLIAAIGEYLEG